MTTSILVAVAVGGTAGPGIAVGSPPSKRVGPLLSDEEGGRMAKFPVAVDAAVDVEVEFVTCRCP